MKLGILYVGTVKELQEKVRTSLAAFGKEDLPMLTNKEFTHVGQLLEILEPVESTTVVMSSGKNLLSLRSLLLQTVFAIYVSIYWKKILSQN